jgi:bacterioferritin
MGLRGRHSGVAAAKSGPSVIIQAMQGNPKVIALLNEALKEELTAINQYFLHAEMCENWHYGKLGAFIKKQSIDEMKHAEKLIERILFLDGSPTLTEALQVNIGKTVREQLEGDLKLEIAAVAMYNRAVKVAAEEGDSASRELFEGLVKDEEKHADWLEAQLHQIKEIGYERYLSQQIREA